MRDRYTEAVGSREHYSDSRISSSKEDITSHLVVLMRSPEYPWLIKWLRGIRDETLVDQEKAVRMGNDRLLIFSTGGHQYVERAVRELTQLRPQDREYQPDERAGLDKFFAGEEPWKQKPGNGNGNGKPDPGSTPMEEIPSPLGAPIERGNT